MVDKYQIKEISQDGCKSACNHNPWTCPKALEIGDSMVAFYGCIASEMGLFQGIIYKVIKIIT
jgi:hypothetical protein